MKKISILAGLLCLQTVFAQENFNFQEVPNSGLPLVDRGSVMAGEINGKKTLLITGIENFTPISAIYSYQNGKFSKENISLTGVGNGQAIYFDYDNDKDLDVALIGIDATNKPKFQIYQNDNGSFKIHQEINELGLKYATVDAGDYDNDGYNDLILTGEDAQKTPKTFIVKNNKGNFSLDNLASKSLTGVKQGTAKFIDIDKTTKGLVLSGLRDRYGTVEVYHYTNGSFTKKQDHYNDDYGYENADIAIADVNNDGFQDIAIIGKGYLEFGSLIMLNDSKGKFVKVADQDLPNLYGDNSTNRVILANLGSDNKTDLIILGNESSEPQKLNVFSGNGDGKFQFVDNAFKNENGQDTNIDYGSEGSSAVFDFNGDGQLDIIVLGRDKNDNYKNWFYLNKSKSLSTENINKSINITISPNPILDIFNVATKEIVESIKIYDFSGKVVKSFLKQENYNISDLPKGGYIVVVKTKNSLDSIKIIKR